MVGGFGYHLELDKNINRDLLRMFISEVMEQIKKDNTLYLGGWYDSDKGIFEVEISRNILNLAPSLLKAIINKQKFIYDIANDKDIKV